MDVSVHGVAVVGVRVLAVADVVHDVGQTGGEFEPLRELVDYVQVESVLALFVQLFDDAVAAVVGVGQTDVAFTRTAFHRD